MATMMIGAVYDALVEAGASPEKSREASEAIASYGERVGKVEQDATERTSDLRGDLSKMREEISDFRGELNTRFAKVDGEITILKWMGGVTVAGIIALIVRAFAV